MIVLDPCMRGCTIWYDNNVQYMHGCVKDICDRIIGNITNEDGLQIYFDIALDVLGIGRTYEDYFKYKNIKFKEVTHKEILKSNI